jgi:hypothetical protein
MQNQRSEQRLQEVRSAVKSGEKIKAIKLYREITGTRISFGHRRCPRITPPADWQVQRGVSGSITSGRKVGLEDCKAFHRAERLGLLLLLEVTPSTCRSQPEDLQTIALPPGQKGTRRPACQVSPNGDSLRMRARFVSHRRRMQRECRIPQPCLGVRDRRRTRTTW